MPCGTKIPVKRVFAAAAVLLKGVCAGTIESSRGSASATPAPRRTVRRDMYFLVMNIGFRSFSFDIYHPSFRSARGTLLGLRVCAELHLLVHLEGLALDDAHHQRRETVVVLFGFVHNGPDQGHVVVFGAAAEGVNQ